MKNDLIIRLSNGCDTIEDFQTKEDWGPHEIVLGPITGMVFTYGTLKVFIDEDWEGELQLEDEGGLIRYDGKYYGDFELISAEGVEDVTSINLVFLMSFNEYKSHFTRIAQKDYMWDDFTDEDIKLGYDAGTTAQDHVDYYASKYNLTHSLEIGM